MPPILSRSILTASLVICSAEASAESHMIGLGNQTCATWTANPPIEGVGLLYQQWALGFLSGASYADPDHNPLGGWTQLSLPIGLTITAGTMPKHAS